MPGQSWDDLPQGIAQNRAVFSDARLRALNLSLGRAAPSGIGGLTVYATGSYARLEASEHSDIDLFFVTSDADFAATGHRIDSLRLFAQVIKIGDELSFPAFSNDGEFLTVISSNDILSHLGGRDDDHHNYFTARMLLLLESRPLLDSGKYTEVLESIVDSYFRDYPDHPDDFRPIFLINDILRFWKTLCLNYEHKRNQPAGDEVRKLKQKVRNFKLKFSRLLTCFATVLSISRLYPTATKAEVMSIVALTPRQRLNKSMANISTRIDDLVRGLNDDYDWFLAQTAMSEAELLQSFGDKEHRKACFDRADGFGAKVFEILRLSTEGTNYLRYIVV